MNKEISIPEFKEEEVKAAMESVRLIHEQIERIGSEDIKDFTYQAFGEVNIKFWTSPSSSTGKYHPEEDHGKGGLVRHTIKAVAVLEQYLRRIGATEREIDMGISAMLLHDTCKNGVDWKSDFTDYTHGLIASKWLKHYYLKDEETKKEILNAVRYHMGQWSVAVSPYEDRLYTKQEMQNNLDELSRAMHPSRIEAAVQEADYWASRQSMSFFPGISVDIHHEEKNDE